MGNTTGPGVMIRLRAAWHELAPQRRSALVSLAVLCGLMAALLLYQRPQPRQPEQALQAFPGAGGMAPAGDTAPAAGDPAPAAGTRALAPAAQAEAAAPDAPAAVTAAAREAPADTGLLDQPLRGEVTQPYGWAAQAGTRDWRLHAGIDIAGQPGDPVVAAGAGTVRTVQEDPILGWTLVLDHGGGRWTRYAGLAAPLALQPGDRVARSQVVARLGRPAPGEAAGGPHLHFAVEVDGDPADPLEHMHR